MQSKLKFLGLAISSLYLMPLLAKPSCAVGENPHARNVIDAIVFASEFHRQTESNVTTTLDTKKKLYLDLASKIQTDNTWTHLPFPKPEKENWATDAKTVAKGLKPSVNYQVAKSRQAALICVDKKIAKDLYNNVRMISWYRKELSKSIAKETSENGSQALAELIDEFLRRLANSLPPTKVTSIGKINESTRQEIQLPDFVLWEILSTINRCFFYKNQFVENAEHYEVADLCLLEAMTKTAILFGAKPPSNALNEIRAELSRDSEGWKKSAYQAIDSWRLVQKGRIDAESNFVNVTLLPKPKPVKNTTPPKANNFPDNVSDIKEVAGRIFIKRHGKCELWK